MHSVTEAEKKINRFLVDVFNDVLRLEEENLARGPHKNLSVSEMHVLEAVDNADFLARGGRARRVITMPERSSYQAMRYTGQCQLDKSASQLQRLEITVAEPFAAWPGDLVRVGRTGWDWNGLYRAAQVTVGMDESGYWSRLELADPDFTV